MTLQTHLHALYTLLADEMAASLEAAMVEAAAAGIAQPTALAADFAPLAEAIDRIKSKTPVVSEMRSAEWAEVPLQIRNRAQFSAGVTSARVVNDIQQRLEAEMSWKPGTAIGRDAFIRGVRESLQAEGIAINPHGGLTDISSTRRLALVHDMQTREARNFAKWKIDQDPDLLAAAPAQELVRIRRSAVPRVDWAERFVAAGGTIRGGRLAAHKLDSVWAKLSRFGNPWPPFDLGSGMGVQDLLADEAEQLGIVPPKQAEAVTERRFNEDAEMDVQSLPPDKIAWLKERMGNQVSVVDGAARLSPLSWRTVPEADAWAETAYADVLADPDEVSALTAYQDRRTGLQARMAQQIRTSTAPDADVLAQTHAIDAVIARSHAATNGLVYRCLDLAQHELNTTDRAHMSTSLCEQLAWARYGIKAKRPVIVKIYLPKGSKGVYLSGLTQANPDQDEAEFLLQRGSMLNIVKQREIEIEGRIVQEIAATIVQGALPALTWRRPT